MKLSDDRRYLLVGERRVPIVSADVADTPVLHGGLFHIRRCEIRGEGWTLSVIWGDATYSDNYDARVAGAHGPIVLLDSEELAEFTEDPATVEAMVLDGPLADGEPRSYLDADQLLALIDELQGVR